MSFASEKINVRVYVSMYTYVYIQICIYALSLTKNYKRFLVV